MLDKGSQSRCQYFRQTLLAGAIERTRQQQHSRVVINAIAVSAIGYRVDRMLEQPGVVAHRQKVIDPHLRNSLTAGCGNVLVAACNHSEPMPSPRGVES